MACVVVMYNSEHKGRCPPISPRISFSNDFVEAHHILKQERTSRPEAPASTDFEFSVANYSMMPADELFFKGRLLPFRDGGGTSGASHGQRTIRDELLVDDEGDKVSHRPPKSSTRWKGLLGLKRSHKGSKKVDTFSSMGVGERDGEVRRPGHSNDDLHGNMSSLETLNEESSRDFEFGV